MKKYPITFVDDYTEPGYSYDEEAIKSNKRSIDFCKKWKGKKITLQELEKFIDEITDYAPMGVIFDGEKIEIYNGYNE